MNNNIKYEKHNELKRNFIAPPPLRKECEYVWQLCSKIWGTKLKLKTRTNCHLVKSEKYKAEIWEGDFEGPLNGSGKAEGQLTTFLCQ